MRRLLRSSVAVCVALLLVVAMGGDRRTSVIALAIAVGLSVAWIVMAGSDFRRRWISMQRKWDFLCPSCGYSLHGNVSGTCPECGTKVK